MPLNRSKPSPLESLPTELLEQIFLQCLNVSLPMSSLHLGAALSSIHLKTTIAMKLFPGDEGHQIATNRLRGTRTLVHYNELSRILWAGNEGETRKAIVNLQSRILACRWMTWDIAKSCMEKVLVQTILREFRARNLMWPQLWPLVVMDSSAPTSVPVSLPSCRGGGATVQESTVIEFVRKTLSMETKKRISYTYDSRSDHVKDLTVASSGMSYCWRQDDDDSRTCWFDIDPLRGKFALRTERKPEIRGTEFYYPHPIHFAFSWACLEANIPTKLLHGPWTEDRLSFLCALSESVADVGQGDPAQRALVSTSLADAIKENNFRAVDAILSVGLHSKRSVPIRDTFSHFRPSTTHFKLAVERGRPIQIVRRLWMVRPRIYLDDNAFYGWIDEEMKINGVDVRNFKKGEEAKQWLLSTVFWEVFGVGSARRAKRKRGC